MKKVLGLALAGVVAVGVSGAFAGSGCCLAGGMKVEAKASCVAVVSPKLSLSAEQKTKLAALEAECNAGKCTEAAHAKFLQGAKEILTPEQYAQWQAECKKSKDAGTCPMKKTDGKK